MTVISKQTQPAWKCGYYIGPCECFTKKGERCGNGGQYYVSVNGYVVVTCSMHKKRLENGYMIQFVERDRDVDDNPLYQHYYGDGRRMRGFDPYKQQVLN